MKIQELSYKEKLNINAGGDEIINAIWFVIGYTIGLADNATPMYGMKNCEDNC